MKRLWLLLACGASLRAAAPGTVDELWAGYDPRELPLEAKVLREWTEYGTTLRTIAYTSEVTDGFKVRVVAYYGFPTGGTHAPAILHLHGGGQNATLGYVKYWAGRGFATLSIDWGGKPLEGKAANGRTDWGPLPYNQNKDDTGSVYVTTPDSRANSWYHWTIAARRAVTFLEQQPEVDAARIGVFGVSMGGRLTWLVAGSDHRIRCAASVVGATLMYRPIDGIPDSEYVPAVRDSVLWKNTLDAHAYAPRIACPFFVLSAADDFYARLDNVDRTLREVPGDQHWRSFTPHFSHHLGADEGIALDFWMYHWLQNGPSWPQEPRVTLRFGPSGQPLTAAILPDRAGTVRSVALHYSTGLVPQARFWRTLPVQASGGQWTVELPLTETGRTVRCYATVAYQNGLLLSTPLALASPRELAAAQVPASDSPTLVIDDFQRGAVDWFVTEASPNVLIVNTDFFRRQVDPEKGPVIGFNPALRAGWRLQTRKVGDPKWRGPTGAGVGFDVRSEQPNDITVEAAENYESLPLPPAVFSAQAHLTGGRWEHVVLPLSAFHDPFHGRPLSGWDRVNLLGIVGQYRFSGGHMRLPDKALGSNWKGPPPLLANVRWVPSGTP